MTISWLLAVALAASAASPPPNPLETEAAAFEARLKTAAAEPSYTLESSIALGDELLALEARARGQERLTLRLQALRPKLPPSGQGMPKFLLYHNDADPKLYPQMNWRDYVDLFAFCAGEGGSAFLREHSADQTPDGDFIDRETKKYLKPERVIALWRAAKDAHLLASREEEPAAAAPGQLSAPGGLDANGRSALKATPLPYMLSPEEAQRMREGMGFDGGTARGRLQDPNHPPLSGQPKRDGA